MKRNYQSMSNHAHADKASQFETKKIRDEYEAVIADLTIKNKNLNTETTEQKEKLKTVEESRKEFKAKTET